MAADQKKPKRRSIKGAKKVSDTGSNAQAIPPQASAYSETKKGYEGQAKSRYAGKNAKKAGKQKTGLRWPQFIFLFFLLALLVAVGLFGWDRWLRYDDAQDFQGEWLYQNGEVTATVYIDDEDIAFTADVAYPYQLDPFAKTIEFTFSDLKGSGLYRFSLDRQTLIIAEGAEEDWFIALKVVLGMVGPEEGFDKENTTVLKRVSSQNTLPETETSGEGALPEDTDPNAVIPGEDQEATESGEQEVGESAEGNSDPSLNTEI